MTAARQLRRAAVHPAESAARNPKLPSMRRGGWGVGSVGMGAGKHFGGGELGLQQCPWSETHPPGRVATQMPLTRRWNATRRRREPAATPALRATQRQTIRRRSPPRRAVQRLLRADTACRPCVRPGTSGRSGCRTRRRGPAGATPHALSTPGGKLRRAAAPTHVSTRRHTTAIAADASSGRNTRLDGPRQQIPLLRREIDLPNCAPPHVRCTHFGGRPTWGALWAGGEEHQPSEGNAITPISGNTLNTCAKETMSR